MKILMPASCFAIILLSLSACTSLNSSRMFKGVAGTTVRFDTMQSLNYTIAIGDRLAIQFYTKYGEELVDFKGSAVTGGTSGMRSNSRSGMEYTVKVDSLVELPVVGNLRLVGQSIPQAKESIREAYKKFFGNLFVDVTVTNRRVLVFRGNQAAETVHLDNENMTLIEVLAIAGGIPKDGKASNVKVIRGDLNNPLVATIDLSKMSELGQGQMIVQPNDIIYIDTKKRVISALLAEINPYLGIITSATTIYLLINGLTNGQ